jgi:hypothetical protein
MGETACDSEPVVETWVVLPEPALEAAQIPPKNALLIFDEVMIPPATAARRTILEPLPTSTLENFGGCRSVRMADGGRTKLVSLLGPVYQAEHSGNPLPWHAASRL